MQNLDPNKIPKHIAIIMDGNGRWAKAFDKVRIFGHQNASKAVKSAINFALKHNIQILTLYAFSTENWKRPESEVNALLKLFFQALSDEIEKLHQHNICLKIIGDKSRFPNDLQEKIKFAEDLTKQNNKLILQIAANYSGFWEIGQAVKEISQKVKNNELTIEQIDQNLINQFLEITEPVDLLIRTGGEKRISNFLLWQIAYAEMFFTPVLWPDFNEQIFYEALLDFQNRERRFGALGSM